MRKKTGKKLKASASKSRVDEIADKIDIIKEVAGFDASSSMDKPGGLRPSGTS